MLRCQPVVDAHDTRTRRDGERLADRIELVEAAEDPAATVVVDDVADGIRSRLVEACRDHAVRAGNLDVSHDGDVRAGADQVDEERGALARLGGRYRGQGRGIRLREHVEKLPSIAVEGHRSSRAVTAAATSGVPYVWKLSIVFTPQNWPRARSAAVHVIGSKSGS